MVTNAVVSGTKALVSAAGETVEVSKGLARVVIEMENRSRRYLSSRWLACPARSGRGIGRLVRPRRRFVPLAAAVFLAASALAVSGPLPTALAATSRFLWD